MIVIRVELHSAQTGSIETIGTACIFNDRSGDQGTGNYQVAVGRRGAGGVLGQQPEEVLRSPVRTGRVVGFPRKSYSVWRLVSRALLAVFPEESHSDRRRG